MQVFGDGCPKGKKASGSAVNTGGSTTWSQCNTGFQAGKQAGFYPPNTPNPCGNNPPGGNPGASIPTNNPNVAVASAIGSAHNVGDAKCKTNNDNNNCKCCGITKVSVSRNNNGFIATIVGKCCEIKKTSSAVGTSSIAGSSSSSSIARLYM